MQSLYGHISCYVVKTEVIIIFHKFVFRLSTIGALLHRATGWRIDVYCLTMVYSSTCITISLVDCTIYTTCIMFTLVFIKLTVGFVTLTGIA